MRKCLAVEADGRICVFPTVDVVVVIVRTYLEIIESASELATVVARANLQRLQTLKNFCPVAEIARVS